MPLPDYQITVISPTSGQTLQVYDGTALHSLRYSRVLNGIGAVVVELPSTPDLPALFVLDALIEVARTRPVTGVLTKDETFFARLTHHFRSEEDERFLAGGLSLNHLIARRVIDPDDDPAAAGGFSTKAGASDTVMEAYAREQMADLASSDRQFPGLTVNTTPGTGRAVGARERMSSLIEVFGDLSRRGEMDFVIEQITGTSLRLNIGPIGTDKTVTRNYPTQPFLMLNPMRGNLSQPSLEIDRRDEGNFVYALGQGQAESRIILKVAGQGISDSPYNRIEFAKDARNIERSDALGLLTEAQASLLEKQPKRQFTFESNGQEPGNIYNLDWSLGDKITAAWDDQSVDLRITEVEIEISQEGEQLNVKTEKVSE